MRGQARFRQRDLTKVIKATRAAGIENARVEIENGKIVVLMGVRVAPPPDEKGGDDWGDI